MPQNKSSKGFTSWCIGDGLLLDFWYSESEFLVARNILSWVVMYLCNLIGAELSMQDGELFHSWCSWICEYLGKANSIDSLSWKCWKSKSKSCNSSQSQTFRKNFRRAAWRSHVAVAILNIKFPWPFERVGEATASWRGKWKTNSQKQACYIFDKGKRQHVWCQCLDRNCSGLYKGVLSIPQSFRSLCEGISYAANICKHEQRWQQNVYRHINCTYIMHTVHKDTDIVGR